MHEWSLASALIGQVEALAAEHGGMRVLSVRVRIGEFSGVEPDLLASAYEQLSVDLRVAGSTLQIEQVPLEATCADCGGAFKIERFQFECPTCAGGNILIRSGEELLLDSVTLEEDET